MEWIKDSGLLTITILGLLLYTLFAIPTAIFYFRLGASLAEVGVTYTSLLSGSVLPLMVIVLSIGYFVAAFYFLNYVSGRRALGTRSKGARKGISIAEHLRSERKDWLLDDEDFKIRIELLKDQYSQSPVIGDSLRLGWREFESKLRRRRELRRMENLTPEESCELQSIERQIANYRIRAYGDVIGAWVRRHPILLCIVYLVVLAIMCTVAFISSVDVQNGRSVGVISEAFGYRAELVTVCPASKADEQMYKWLAAEEKVYLLGETAQNAVLYLPAETVPHPAETTPHPAETIQVPIAAVIISSSTSSTGHCRGS